MGTLSAPARTRGGGNAPGKQFGSLGREIEEQQLRGAEGMGNNPLGPDGSLGPFGPNAAAPACGLKTATSALGQATWLCRQQAQSVEGQTLTRLRRHGANSYWEASSPSPCKCSVRDICPTKNRRDPLPSCLMENSKPEACARLLGEKSRSYLLLASAAASPPR